MEADTLVSGAVVAAARDATRKTGHNGEAKRKQTRTKIAVTIQARLLRPGARKRRCAETKSPRMHRGSGGVAKLAGEIGLFNY